MTLRQKRGIMITSIRDCWLRRVPRKGYFFYTPK
nr:MAG TPA: hypothetical protein [Caudoviricetes sp.]